MATIEQQIGPMPMILCIEWCSYLCLRRNNQLPVILFSKYTIEIKEWPSGSLIFIVIIEWRVTWCLIVSHVTTISWSSSALTLALDLCLLSLSFTSRLSMTMTSLRHSIVNSTTPVLPRITMSAPTFSRYNNKRDKNSFILMREILTNLLCNYQLQ